MEIGFIGLGKMGMNMVTRLQRDRHRVVVYDQSADLIKQAEDVGCVGASSLADLVGQLKAPRAVWVMVPSGAPTEETVQAVATLLHPGDTVIDGGNTRFHDDVRRAGDLAEKTASLYRCWDERGRLGFEDRLLPDGRWRQSAGETARTDLHDTGAAEQGWSHVGGAGRRPLCENGA